MQASKIEIGRSGYGLQHPELGLVRFSVRKIVTTRVHNGVPTSVVYGWIEDLPDQPHDKLSGPFDPDLIKGDYREFKELVERKARDNAAKQAERDARTAAEAALVARLNAAGITAKARGYGGIEIDESALPALNALLDRGAT